MKPSYPILTSLLSTFLFLCPAVSQISATVSIYNNPAFTSQRLCAIECILCGYGTYGQHDCIAAALSCSSPLQNNCYCRSDLQPAAISYVASCVSSACSNTVDVNNAVGIYTQYCETADQTTSYVPASTTQAATTTLVGASKSSTTGLSLSNVLSTITAANGQTSTILVKVTPTSGSSRNQTASSNNLTSSSEGPDLSSIIGSTVGGALILGIAAIIITWMILRERRKRRQMGMMAFNGPAIFPPTNPLIGHTSTTLQSGMASISSSNPTPLVSTRMSARLQIPPAGS